MSPDGVTTETATCRLVVGGLNGTAHPPGTVPYATNGGTRLYYETQPDGDDEAGADDEPAVTFLPDLGVGPWQWAWQAPQLAGAYRTVVPTPRGCGRSDSPDGPWTAGDLLADLRAVWRDAGVDSTHLVAAGLGGHLALAAARRFGQVRRVALLGTPHPEAAFDAEAMYADPSDDGAITASLSALVTDAFHEQHPNAVDRITAWRADEDADREAFLAARDAIADCDLDPLYEIGVETLLIQGTSDRVCSLEAGRRLAADLPRGSFQPIADAGHLVGCEAARPVTDRLFAFFGEPFAE